MTILHFDGFDHYTSIAYRYDLQFGADDTFGQITPPAISATAARHGNGGLLLTNGGMIYKVLPDSSSLALGVSFSFTSDPPANGRKMISFRDDGYENCYLYLNSAKKITVVGASGASLGTTSTEFETNRWYFLEFAATFSSSGTYSVSVDGAVDITSTGNLAKTSNNHTNVVRFGSASSGYYNFYYDDLYITDGALLGPCYADELPAVSATYPKLSSSSNTTDALLFDVGDFDILGNVFAVSVHSLAYKLYGNTRAIYNLIAPVPGTAYAGAVHYLSTSGYFHTDIWENNPHTSGTFDLNSINSMQIGYQRYR